jgi:hypothetical protein
MTCDEKTSESFPPDNFQDLVELLVGEESAHEFLLWAFGESYEEAEMLELANKWNKIHGDILKLDMDSPIAYDLIEMTHLWKSVRYENEEL